MYGWSFIRQEIYQGIEVVKIYLASFSWDNIRFVENAERTETTYLFNGSFICPLSIHPREREMSRCMRLGALVWKLHVKIFQVCSSRSSSSWNFCGHTRESVSRGLWWKDVQDKKMDFHNDINQMTEFISKVVLLYVSFCPKKVQKGLFFSLPYAAHIVSVPFAKSYL